ncbi:HD domain-containing phosphohydrolase [Desulfofustis glycolicus]|nr:HD domain-containing phosphohydrolase [Desulfofustis glycolicus]
MPDSSNQTTETILFVDDESNILDSMRRQLRNRFSIETATSGQEALEKCKKNGPFAVIVADMRMPGMDGVRLLGMVKELYPETVRMMLTGNADQGTASEAVNKGQIFRFLTKPCPVPTLVPALALALRQYRLVTAERELLNKTLSGSIKILSELLSYTNPAAFSSSVRIRPVVLTIGRALAVDDLWQLEIAVLMSQIGCVTLPAEILAKHYAGRELDPEERRLFVNHPRVGTDLLQHIPRMEGVARIIGNQLKPFCHYDHGDTNYGDEDLGAQTIRAAFDYDLLLTQGVSHGRAIGQMAQQPDEYNPEVLTKLARCQLSEHSHVASLRVRELRVGMIVEDDIEALNGTLLAPKGQEITWPVLQGLINFSRQSGVKEPIRVRIREQSTSESN